MIGNSVIMELIANGVLWHYESYDHKAAVDEIMKTKHIIKTTNHLNGFEYRTYPIPDEIKHNHLLLRVGKLRSMKFDTDGMIAKMYVGRSFKYVKAFFPQEIGTERIKPILNKNDDKFGLIKAGLAVDETILNLNKNG